MMHFAHARECPVRKLKNNNVYNSYLCAEVLHHGSSVNRGSGCYPVFTKVLGPHKPQHSAHGKDDAGPLGLGEPFDLPFSCVSTRHV